MRILIMTVLMGLPLMALGQAEPQKTTTQGQTTQGQTMQGQTEEKATTQGQTEETQAPAPAKEKKMHSAQATNPQEKSEQGTDVRGKRKVEGSTQDVNRSEHQHGMRSSTTKTKVNVQEFRARHREVFSLGRHPKEFFGQRFGSNHFHLIGNTYFVFVDSCWVAVDVDGFTYTERVICPGDPDFIEIY
jgi:hypothetical protein